MSEAALATPVAAAEAPGCAEDLRRVEIFGDLEDEQLEWILGHGECLELEPGDPLWLPGQPADAMFVVLRGSLQLIFDVVGQNVRVTDDRWGGILGLLPYSRMEEFRGKSAALEPSRVLRLGEDLFTDMLHKIPELGYRLVALMSDRVREGTRFEQQREKMMALGKLSAGLAHELNNPASAVARAASALRDGLESSNVRVVRLVEHGVGAEQMRRLVALRATDCPPGELSTLERGELEDELADFLEDRGIEDGFVLAESFVAAGLTAEALEQAFDDLPGDAEADAIAWVAGGLGARQLLGEVGAASRRISDLVKSVKAYSHMDQSPETETRDLHLGLDETLTMLGHPLKKKSIRVERRYDENLPPVPLYPSEINQVWTNLLDNAIDAVAEGGRITLETEHDGCSVFVRVIDDGPGMSEEVRQRIFEPFYTTKAAGQGTGLGLDIVHRIVLQHRGEILVDSEPGKTVFTVRLPLEAS